MKFVLYLFIIGCITYVNSLHNPFVLDDHEFFDNPHTDARALMLEFVPPKSRWVQPGVEVTDAYYRPLAHVLPMLSYKAFGKNTVGHHVVNLILLIIASLMIYFLIRSLTGKDFLAFCAAAFYLAHPINGILVNHIAASVFSVQVICMAASLLLSPGVIASEAKQSFVAIFFFILALMCHETAMALPFYLLAILVFIRRYSFKDALFKTLPFFILLALYFIFRLQFASFNVGILSHYALFHMNAGEYLASVAKLIFWYLRELVSPGAIVPIWATAVARQSVGWWMMGLLLLIAGWIWAIDRLKNKPIMALGIAWLAIGFGPVFFACLFQPTRALIIEPHWFVFSSIGFFLIVAAIVSEMKIAVFFLLIIPWMALSHMYNTLWSNEINYCYYWMQKAPDFKGAISFELAQAYDLQGNYPLARLYYGRGLTSHPNDWLRYHSRLGLMALKEGKWQEAREHFLSALEIDGHSAVNLNNVGAAYLQEGKKEIAQQYFLKAISADPYFLLPRLNLADMYEEQGNWQQALETYHDTLKIMPYQEMTLIRVLKIYWDRHDKANIIAIAKELAAYSHDPLTQRNVRIILQTFNK